MKTNMKNKQHIEMNEKIKKLAKKAGISVLYDYYEYDGHAGVCVCV